MDLAKAGNPMVQFVTSANGGIVTKGGFRLHEGLLNGEISKMVYIRRGNLEWNGLEETMKQIKIIFPMG